MSTFVPPIGDHQLQEEIILQEINTVYTQEESGVTQNLLAESFVERLVSYIVQRTTGNKGKGNMYLIKTYLTPAHVSKINRKKYLSDLYQLINDLQWIQVHPTKNYSLAEVKTRAIEAQKLEKTQVDYLVEKLDHLQDAIEQEIGRRWGRIEDV